MQDPLKSGFKTTEFLGVVISMLVSTMVMFKVLPAEQAMVFQDQVLQFTSLCVQLITIIGALAVAIRPLIKYIESRTTIKTAAVQRDNLTPPTTV